jgi:ferrous iron transport protein B
MFVVFWFTISVGGAFIDFFDIVAGGIFVDGLGSLLGTVGTPDWLVAVIALAILEDSGYMARAAFVMDRLMRWIGLPGKSFVPMLLGFGCSIPAVMATKTLESRRDRLDRGGCGGPRARMGDPEAHREASARCGPGWRA